MKKIVMAGALAAAVTVGLVAAPKAEASSAKYTIKQYRTVKKYKHGMKATFSYQLPQLKGNYAAVKKINKDLKKSYSAEKKNSKTVFHFAKQDAADFSNQTYFDTTTTKATYNKSKVISFRTYKKWWAGGVRRDTLDSLSYSLKTGKKLNVYDVAKGSRASVKRKLVKGAKKLGAESYYFQSLDLKDLSFVLKNSKVYVYPQVNGPTMLKSFTLPARYKQ